VQLAVTPTQIGEWRLPSRPTKRSDARAARFGRQRSVELDAIAPDRLRALVRAAIEQHLPAEQYEVLKAAEQSEREGLIALANAVRGKDIVRAARRLNGKRG